MTVEAVRYNFRIRPGAVAVAALEAEWHRCRFIWNEAVHLRTVGLRPTGPRLNRLLTAARRDNAWLRSGSVDTQQMTMRNYAVSLNRAYTVKGQGLPQFKRRHGQSPALEYSKNGFRITEGRLWLAKMPPIPVVWSRELPSEPTSVSVYRDSVGHWYASFVVRREVPTAPTAVSGIGIDWGVTTTATTSDPRFDLPFGGHRHRCAAELAKAQRKMSRRRRPRGASPSAGYRIARRAAAKLHQRAQRQSQHEARAWAKRVVVNHELIAIEDFRPKFLAKSTMARKAADAAIGATKLELIDRAKRAGRTVVMVQPAYTTMTCSSCFARAKQRLGLAERVFLCRECGHTDTRDRNAARVILAVAERGHTSVDDVRHGSASPFGVAVLARSELGTCVN